MEPLPNEPLDLRLLILEDLLASGKSLQEARILEDRLHQNRCRFEAGPIPKWHYGLKCLFATDPRDKHIHEARKAYIDLSHASLCPTDEAQTQWKIQLETNLDFAKKVLEEREVSTKGIFQCPGCKSYDVDTEQKQTRSADEPMTIFCECRNCHRKFVR